MKHTKEYLYYLSIFKRMELGFDDDIPIQVYEEMIEKSLKDNKILWLEYDSLVHKLKNIKEITLY